MNSAKVNSIGDLHNTRDRSLVWCNFRFSKTS